AAAWFAWKGGEANATAKLYLVSFTFILKTPPTPVLLRQKAGLEKAAKNPGKEVAGSVTDKDIEEVAKIKMPDLNANDLEAAKQQVRGTARSMGLTVVG
ncbi:MAG: hypothetical protein EBY89_01930, partial [Actinobacteria bacterium]|nr:hypothetical protein [Actinomycetota bacterium]